MSEQSRDGVKVFLSYSLKDEKLRENLDEHLGALKYSGLISVWHDRKIMPGDTWDLSIEHHIETADIIVFLVSSSLLNSEYINTQEIPRALKRKEEGFARVVPVIVRPCFWQETPLASLQGLPSGMKPISRWKDQDEAFADVAAGLYVVVRQVAREKGGKSKASQTSGKDQTQAGNRTRPVILGSQARPDIESAAWLASEAATLAQKQIQQAFASDHDLKLMTFHILGRVKAPSRILHDLLRSSSKMENNDLAFSGACEFRLLTLYRGDILRVLAHLLRLVRHDPNLGKSPFRKNKVDVVFYKSASISENSFDVIRRSRDLIQRLGYPDVKLQIRAGSSLSESVCLMVECEVDGSPDMVVVPVRIKIQTVLEETWGQVSHELSYRPHRDARSAGSNQDNLQLLQERILTLDRTLEDIRSKFQSAENELEPGAAEPS